MAEEQNTQGTPPAMDPELEKELAAQQAESESWLEDAAPAGPVRKSQAGYMSARKAVKEAAAEVVKANAEEAQKAKKKALAKKFEVKGAKEFNSKAHSVEAEMAARRKAREEAKAK